MNALFEWLSKLVQGVKLWVVVRPWERCVRVRLGKHVRVLGAGVHPRIPLFDEVMLFNSRLRIASFPTQTLTTTDGKTVAVAGNVGFRIDDPERAMRSLQQPEYSCAGLVQSFVAAYVTTRGSGEVEPDDLQTFAKDELTKIADGIAIEYVAITDFSIVSRTFRLLGDEWRPSTKPDTHDKFNE